MQEFYIKPVAWATHEAALKLVREKVFIEEQKVPVSLEWDDWDKQAWHLLAVDKQLTVVGCARVLQHGSIGRMAVIQEKRKLGVGNALLTAAIELCQQHHLKDATLSAQTHAVPFYEKAGFVVVSDVYLDANIPHMDMQLKF